LDVDDLSQVPQAGPDTLHARFDHDVAADVAVKISQHVTAAADGSFPVQVRRAASLGDASTGRREVGHGEGHGKADLRSQDRS
jgi:hypothetical protein